MHQAVELPLTLHFFLTPQTEPVQSFRRANIAEHRFHYRHAMAVDLLVLGAIDSVLHPISVIGQPIVLDDKRYLSTGTVPMALAVFILWKTDRSSLCSIR